MRLIYVELSSLVLLTDMFLFHWCMNAIRCRRDMTLETTPLSPTKYNGLPPSLDCELQRQLVDDMPASSYDVTIVNRPLMDEDVTVDPSSFFPDRLNTACLRGQQSATEESTCHSKLRDLVDVTAGGLFHPDDLDEPMSSPLTSTLSTDDIAANGIKGQRVCECETDAAVKETTAEVTYSFDVSSKSVPSLTRFCPSSSQFPQPQLCSERQREVLGSDDESSLSLVINDDLPRDTQDVGFLSRHSSRFADGCVSDASHRNVVASFPVDTFQDPLVTVAMLLVNSAVNAAVRILDNDVALTSDKNPTNEIILRPVSNTPNSIQPLPTSDESIKDLEDPLEVAASRLVSQVVSEIGRKSSSSAFACTETLLDETSISKAVCAADSYYSSSSCSRCESDSKLSADNDVERCAAATAADAGSVLMPAAAADDYFSESSATVCSSVDESEMLAAHEPVGVPNCDCNSAYILSDDFESTSLLSSGRLTFVSEVWSPVSPPFADAYSPVDVPEVLNNNSVVAESFDDIDGRRRLSDDLKLYDNPLQIDDDAQARVMCSAERDIDQSGNGDIYDATSTPFDYGVSDDDNYPDVHITRFKQHTSETDMVIETRNSCESSYRPEDYFFHRYVIPVDQFDAGAATSTTISGLSGDAVATQKDRDEQRTKMQLDLNAEEQNNDTDIDAEIEAVAAFCRAMFIPVETDIDYIDDKIPPFDVVSSPETPNTEERHTLGCRPAAVRRCISLRTSPGTPHKKKSVRFADALGLDLEYVRQIQTDELPLPTITSCDDGAGWARRPLLAEASAAWRRSRPLVRRYLCACFQEPGNRPDFVERVLRSRVVLENCEADDRASKITGVIRVANVAYHKTVAARVTTDGWATQTDVTAEYVPRSNDGTTDRFSFQIILPHGATDLGRRVEFAVYFIAFFDFDNRSETYWDNNFGANYCFECYGHEEGETSTLDTDNDDDGQFSPWLRFA